MLTPAQRQKILNLKGTMPYRDIGEAVGCSHVAVGRVLKAGLVTETVAQREAKALRVRSFFIAHPEATDLTVHLETGADLNFVARVRKEAVANEVIAPVAKAKRRRVTTSRSSMKRQSKRPKRGYTFAWKAQPKTLELARLSLEVIKEYREHLPVTVRQIMYRLIGKHGYTKKIERSLYNAITDARRAINHPLHINFEDIHDLGVEVSSKNWLTDRDDLEAYVASIKRNFRRDLLANQPRFIVIWCEAAGMVAQLARVADPYCIRVYSCSGYDSVSAKKGLEELILKTGKPATILHLGDHDPSGKNIYNVLKEDVLSWAAHDHPGFDIEFVRVALTPEQIEEYGIPSEGVNPDDNHAVGWHGPTSQLEALSPAVIAEKLEAAIVGLIDLDQLAEDEEQQELDRAAIAYAAGPGPFADLTGITEEGW